MKTHQLQSCFSHLDLQLWFWSIFHPRLFEKSGFQNFKTLDINLRLQIISNEIVANYKVVYLIEIYNFGFGRFPIIGIS